MDVRIRPYQDGDEDQIVELTIEAFGDWPSIDINCTKTEYWKWKQVDTPIADNMVMVALDGDRIIGVSPQNFVHMKLMDDQVLGCYAGDLSVHRDYRGQGVSKRLDDKMAEREIKNTSFSYFVTQNPVLVKSYDKYYPRFPVPILNLVRIRDLDLQLEHMPMPHEWLIKIGYKSLQFINKLKNIPRVKPSLTFEQVSVFPEDVEYLLKANEHLKFHVNNKRVSLNWRYCDPRAGAYKIWVAHHEGIVVGYTVSRVNRFIPNYPIGYIVDMLTLPGRDDIADALLEVVLSDLDSDNVNIVTAMVPKGHFLEQVYTSYGFVDSMRNLNLYTNLNLIKKEHLFDGILPNEVHFSYGAIDSTPTSIPK